MTHIYSRIYKDIPSVFQEIEEAETEIKKVLGNLYNTHVFRFPGGSYGGYYKDVKKEATNQLKEKKHAYVNWNVLTNDSAGANTLEKQIETFENTRKNQTGLIILQHDSYGKKHTVEVAKYIITTLRNEGYTFRNFYDFYKRPIDLESENKQKEEAKKQEQEKQNPTENVNN